MSQDSNQQPVKEKKPDIESEGKTKAKRNKLEEQSVDDLLNELNTSMDGLSQDEVDKRQQK